MGDPDGLDVGDESDARDWGDAGEESDWGDCIVIGTGETAVKRVCSFATVMLVDGACVCCIAGPRVSACVSVSSTSQNTSWH